MNPITIKCPHCQKEVSIDQALSHQFAETQKLELEAEKQKLHKIMEDWKISQAEKLGKLAEVESSKKLEQSAKELELLKKQLEESQVIEIKLRQEKNKLDDDKKAFELLKQRQLDEERSKIKEEAKKTANEENQFIISQMKKQLEDTQNALDEARRKSEQGSQQLQGEVLELELENELKVTFPVDEILPVPKGVHGADIIQKVKNSNGQVCGTIVWETKRTKAWGGDWTQKLKEDMLRVKGDVAVLVSISLPEGVKNFGHKDGIYVSTFDSYLSLAQLLRKTLIDHQMIKLSVVGKNEKMEVVYNYFLSSDFQQRVAIIAEAFSEMKTDLDNEKKVMTKLWSKREKEIDRVVINTVSMHGELQGLIGKALPAVDSLELDSLTLGFEDN